MCNALITLIRINVDIIRGRYIDTSTQDMFDQYKLFFPFLASFQKLYITYIGMHNIRASRKALVLNL